MKKILQFLLELKLAVLFALFLLHFPVSAQNSQWLEQGGGQKPDEAYSISTDGSNNTYTTGYFTGNAKFGANTLVTMGVSNIFVTKTDVNGNYLWAVQAGGNGQNSRGLAIKTDLGGNSYVTGWYYGIATFGTYTLTSSGKQDVFIAKYNSSGQCQWAVSGGGKGGDIGNAITIDNLGNPVVTGEFQDTAVFGSFSLKATGSNVNVFTAKLDAASGNFIWVKSGTGPHSDRGLGVACDPSGNVYVEGSFTDTITFDYLHKGTIYNAIFLIKYTNAGKEVWFTTAAGSIYGIANAIAADANNHIYMTGDFQGILSFFWNNHQTNLKHIYANRIFVCKYDTAANLLWDTSDASSSWVTSRNLAVDNNGNVNIIGHFRCVMNSFADRYGQGTFNSVGFWDVFVANYSSIKTSSWQWSQQIGGDKNNYGWGITLDNSGDIFTCGSFDLNMVVATGSNFLGYHASLVNPGIPPYCSDPNYGNFEEFRTYGNLDAFIAKPIDYNRVPYDYYYRSANTCLRPFVGVCINNSSLLDTCMDTVQFCVRGTLYANSHAYKGAGFYDGYFDNNDYYGGEPGPYFRYQWSNGSTKDTSMVSSSGWYHVTQISWDSCFISTDSVYVIIHPLPPKPVISDNVIINTNAINPQPIVLCRDSVLLTGGNYGNNKYYWYDSTLAVQVNSDSLWVRASDSDYCHFIVVDSNGCQNDNFVKIVLDSALPKIIPKLYCVQDTADHDTVTLCQGGYFVMYAYDSISNPLHKEGYCIPPKFRTQIYWHAGINPAAYSRRQDCANNYGDNNTFYPSDSGWYYITDTVVRKNTCGSDMYVTADSIYVKLHPNPVIQLTVSPNQTICPGGIDSALLIASCNYPFRWSTGSTSDSIWVIQTGPYTVSSTATNQWGCSASALQSVRVDTPPQPLITMNPSNGIICPYDSVYLQCSGAGTFNWYGPVGPFGGNQNYAYGNVPGLYYCVLHDLNGCKLLSNTVILEQYTTPFLWAYPSPFLCWGDSVLIHVACSPGANIQWQPPLYGSDSLQYVKAAGTYTCTVVSCGIVTNATITIGLRNIGAGIKVTNPILCSPGDSAILTADSAMANYLWMPGNYNSRTIIVKTGGIYSLTVTDSGGCKGTSSVIIKQGIPMHDSISALQNINCYNSNTGSITAGVRGGTMPYTYQWSPPAGSSATITGLSAGTYSVQITDSNGCQATASAVIVSPSKPLHDSLYSIKLLCCNTNTGSAVVVASGGWGGYKYLWNPGAQTSSSITGLTAGTYTVTITDSLGCTLTDSIIVTQPACIVLSDTTVNAHCENNDGQASVSATGGTGNYTYLWNPGGQTTSTITGLSAGTYTVTVTDANGCSASAVVVVRHSDDERAMIRLNTDSACRGQSITMTVTGAQSYLWSNGATDSSIVFIADSSMTWSVICTKGICADTSRAKFYCYPPLQTGRHNGLIVCQGHSDTVFATVSGGKPPYIYQWNNGITADSPGPFIMDAGISVIYICNISDGCSYSAIDSISVNVVLKPVAMFEVSPDTVAPGDAVNFINQSKYAASYLWNFGNGTTGTDSGMITYTFQHSGAYQIMLIAFNSLGCPDSASEVLNVKDKVLFPNIFTPNGDGKNDMFMVKISEALCYNCQIYNRWGTLMYESDDINRGWDGKDRRTGDAASNGEYYYIVHYCDKNNTPFTRYGYFTLIR
ncbi:MAG: T9SS type B sorting domain-containing protein [Bacteroidia bacterium]|nr:T9SS type B sorting domain-containing protein [Bacteroidia bacterium]